MHFMFMNMCTCIEKRPLESHGPTGPTVRALEGPYGPWTSTGRAYGPTGPGP